MLTTALQPVEQHKKVGDRWITTREDAPSVIAGMLAPSKMANKRILSIRSIDNFDVWLSLIRSRFFEDGAKVMSRV